MGLGFTISLVDMATGRTGPAGIARIDKADRDTGKLRFVGDKRLQLPKGPGRQYRTLRLASPDPRADVLQDFKSNLPLRAFSRRYDIRSAC